MSIITYNEAEETSSPITVELDKNGQVLNPKAIYQPDQTVVDRTFEVIRDFVIGDMTMRKPRREWNDMSTLDRMTVDQMAFNTYQPNDGDGPEGDEISSWRSNAVRPVVRNKVISIAAHATARLVFPKVFAEDDTSEEQKDSATVMEDLMEWAADQSNYSQTSIFSSLSALVNPASIVYTEYSETYRTVKKGKDDKGEWVKEQILDDEFSGFQDTVVPVDELYIQNFYEHDIQKQGFLIWRRVVPFSTAQAKYSHFENFQYVKPGVQTIYNDANQTFYEVYDSNLRQYDVEEIVYWRRNDDLKITLLNGVMMCDPENPNPRLDKKYPFIKFGYELMDEGKCFYFKSLVFKMGPDAKIINTLYPMIIDGTYLNIMPPLVVTGSEIVGSDVIVPGAVTTIVEEGSTVTPIQTATNLKQGFDTLMTVENSIEESSQAPIQQGVQDTKTNTTAYEISRLEQNASTVLGLFIKMRGQFVKEYGELRLSDILQYMTISQVKNIEEGTPELVFKSFLLPDKQAGGRTKTRKIAFDMNMPTEPITEKEKENMSFDVLEEQGGPDSNLELWKVNPELFRNLKYTIRISPDIINPMSEDLERAFSLEEYDRAIANPLLDQNAVTRDFLLGAYPKSRKNPDKYMAKQPQGVPGAQMMSGPSGSPLTAIMGKKGGLPQTPSASPASVS